MPRTTYRTRLTNDEWNAISHITRTTHLDEVFDVWSCGTGKDYFYDFEEDKRMSLKSGLSLLYESLAYPLSHDGLNTNESQLIVNLLKEFKVVKDKEADWLLQPEK